MGSSRVILVGQESGRMAFKKKELTQATGTAGDKRRSGEGTLALGIAGGCVQAVLLK